MHLMPVKGHPSSCSCYPLLGTVTSCPRHQDEWPASFSSRRREKRPADLDARIADETFLYFATVSATPFSTSASSVAFVATRQSGVCAMCQSLKEKK
jgi:hypothetical protein